MNAEDALAFIKDVEKPADKGRKEDDRRGQKGNVQIVGLMTRVNRKTKKLFEW